MNNGSGFEDITAISGIVDINTLTFVSSFLDYNNDGMQDLYIANDKNYVPNQLFENLGNGFFQDVSSISGADIEINAMSIGAGDYDNDGDTDIYVTEEAIFNILLRNNGDGTFTDVGAMTGVNHNELSWGANFFDCDNDLDLDLYVSSSTKSFPNTSVLFVNEINEGDFSPVFLENDSLSSYANAIGDFNLDGLLDIAVNNSYYAGTPGNDNHHLWQNVSSNSNNWLKVFLVGTESNRDGIGTWIEFYINGNKYVRYKHCAIGYQAQNSALEHFGMGSHTQVDSIICSLVKR